MVNDVQTAVWRETLELEVASAENVADAGVFRRLVTAYDALELGDEGLKLINRLPALKVDNRVMLPFMLDSLVRQRSLAKLNQATRLVLQIRDRGPELRRSLARALALLGQAQGAAAEWKALLDAHAAIVDARAMLEAGNGRQEFAALTADDWRDLARFVAQVGDVEGLRDALHGAQHAFSGFTFEPLARFCLLCCQLEHSHGEAARTLHAVPTDSLGDAELDFTLGIAAFRLGDYGRAAAAASHALEGKPGWPVAEAALATFLAFGGKSRKGLGAYNRPLPVVALPPGTEEAARAAVAHVPAKAFAWGHVRAQGARAPEARLAPFEPPAYRALDVPEAGAAATFSVLPVKRPDPFQVLPYLDWSVPHILIQRSARHSTCHVFVGVSGHREWFWEPVRVQEATGPPPVAPRPGRAVHWRAVSEELAQRNREEDL